MSITTTKSLINQSDNLQEEEYQMKQELKN